MPNTIIPRGIRNNNPLNIRHSKDHWQGMSAEQDDDAFVTFDTPVMGIRAAMKILTNYGLQTVWDIISRWAPASENNTKAYAENVAGSVGVGMHEKINVRDQATIIKLVQAMSIVENGKPSSFPNWLHKDAPFWYNQSIYEAAWGSLNSKGK